LTIVDGLLIQNSEISSLTFKNATAVGVATVVPSRFFSYSTFSFATVTGIVQVKLVGDNRRLGDVKFDTESVGIASARGMRGENVARPGYNGNDETPFELTIGMERHTIEVPHIMSSVHRYDGDDETSSSAMSVLEAVSSFVASIVCFAFWAIFW